MLQMLKALIRMTALEPRQAASVIKANIPAYPQALQFAVLVVITESLIAVMFSDSDGSSGFQFVNHLIGNPLMLAGFQFATFGVSVGLTYGLGRYFGGTGTFLQSIVLLAWLQFFMLLMQMIMLPLTVVSVSLVQTIALAANIFAVWLLTNFVAELHGFPSLLKVFAGIVGILFALIFVVVMFMTWIDINQIGA